MSIRVEFFGIARQRAGVSQIELPGPTGQVLADVLATLADRLPQFASCCLLDGRLDPTFSANLDGLQFVSEGTTPISDGQTLLILSADAGG
jgi:molybdopterin converting factor small subunit